MQKARCHPNKSGLQPACKRTVFRYYFTLLFGVLFTFPSRYLFAIGLSGVFSLTRWSWQIQTEFLVFRPTQGTARIVFITCTGLSPSVVGFSKTFPVLNISPYRSPTTPTLPKQYWFRLFPVRSPLLWESLLFSFPPGT